MRKLIQTKLIFKMILGCLLMPLFSSCTDGSSEEDLCIEPIANAVNTNGDSELALLMRQMYLEAAQTKENIVCGEGNVTPAFIMALQEVHSAVPTDPSVKTPEFEAFNKLLIFQAKAIQANENAKISEFNALVYRCIDCHKRFCPGPIVRIKKLEIKPAAD